MKKTIQAAASRAPTADEDKLGLVIKCVSCGTARNFSLDSVMSMLLNRQTAAVGVKSFCSMCGTEISAAVCWLSKHQPGWTSKDIPALDGFEVEDALPMSEVEPNPKRKNN